MSEPRLDGDRQPDAPANDERANDERANDERVNDERADGAPTAAPPRPVLPGDRRPGKADIARFIRVDHAGEFGAQQIYRGQRAILGHGKYGDILRHMQEQEEVHLKAFETLIVERRVRPSVLHPVWSVAGLALGLGTALMGRRAAMACTVAVEEVIDEHYQAQIAAIGDDPEEAELKATLETFRAEELEHRDIGLEHGAEEAIGYPVLRSMIKAGSRTAIWLAERF